MDRLGVGLHVRYAAQPLSARTEISVGKMTVGFLVHVSLMLTICWPRLWSAGCLGCMS